MKSSKFLQELKDTKEARALYERKVLFNVSVDVEMLSGAIEDLERLAEMEANEGKQLEKLCVAQGEVLQALCRLEGYRMAVADIVGDTPLEQENKFDFDSWFKGEVSK